jgi:cytochrome c peroxidase
VRGRHGGLLAALLLGGCAAGRPGGTAAPFFSRLPLGAVATLPVPADNPLGCEQVELGGRLFFEARLSRSGATSCATCHVPERSFTDGRPVAVGDAGALGRRNTPTILGRAYGRSQFLDGRVGTLELQALLPLTNPAELANTPAEILRRLSADPRYPRQFARAFGSPGISLERLAAALASFQRTLVAGDAPVDRVLVLGDSGALSPAARRGFALFQGKGACVICHEPPHFTEERFHNTGVAWNGSAYRDSGRYSVTRRSEDLGAFKTPTLRNVARTAPFMHDGSIATLEEVVAFYDRGGNPNPQLDPALRPLRLTAGERDDLVAFLGALTGPVAGPGAGSCR